MLNNNSKTSLARSKNTFRVGSVKKIRRRVDLMLVLSHVGMTDFTRTNALESRDFGHRGKPAGESVVNWAWNPFDD